MFSCALFLWLVDGYTQLYFKHLEVLVSAFSMSVTGLECVICYSVFQVGTVNPVSFAASRMGNGFGK